MVVIQAVSPKLPGVPELVAELDALQIGLYGEEFCHLDSVDDLSAEHVVMLAAMDGPVVAGVGAIKLCARYGELKRVIVHAAYRGRGIAKRIVLELECLAAAHGRSTILCETGVRQEAARQLYAALGYGPTRAFGQYEENAVSVFLRKELPASRVP